MYGTVFRYRVKPGIGDRLPQLLKEFDANPPEGFVAGWTYQLDAGTDQYITAVSFSDKDAYVKNADSPEQAAFFERFRDLLAGDVEWNDGEIVVEQKR
jgi:hypothetical protein